MDRQTKVRRGTSNCWECKRRKIGCHFESRNDSVCLSCRRRGTKCWPQHLGPSGSCALVKSTTKVDADDAYHHMGRQLDHVESLANKLLRQSDKSCRGSLERLPCIAPRPSPATDYQLLVTHLQSFLPPATTATLILHRGSFFSVPLRLYRQELNRRDNVESPASLARSLLQFAVCLEHINSEPDCLVSPQDIGLSASISDTAKQYLTAASQYVTSNEALVCSVDGVQALILESVYHLTVGNWHLAWRTSQRAVALGIKTKPITSNFLSRLIHSEVSLSLMLGRPSCVPIEEGDNVPQDDAIAFRRLLRIHSRLMFLLCLRNERLRALLSSDTYLDNQAYDELDKENKAIDRTLRQSTKSLQSKEWMVPPGTTPDSNNDDAARLTSHIHHYYLMALTHLPYLISLSTHGQGLLPAKDYTYNKFAALTACRDLLSRFIEHQLFTHIASWSRGIGVKVITAAVIITVGHIEGHRLGEDNILEMRRLNDIGAVERLIPCLEKNKVVFGSQIAVMGRLLKVESEAASGVNLSVWFLGDRSLENDEDEAELKDRYDSSGNYSLLLPGFGVLHVVRLNQTQTIPSCPTEFSELPYHLPAPDINTAFSA
jgi:hypothetical protein